jgi:hypothetical protein
VRSEGLDIDERFGKEYAGHYVFGEITWAKRSRICQRNTKYSKMTGQVESSDFVAIQGESIWASLKQQPESRPITLEKLLGEEEGVPIELGELFSKVVNRLNGVSHDELRFLLEQLSEENRMQLLASFGYAKSSAGQSSNSEGSQQKASSSS